jgi:hypothetical protein
LKKCGRWYSKVSAARSINLKVTWQARNNSLQLSKASEDNGSSRFFAVLFIFTIHY